MGAQPAAEARRGAGAIRLQGVWVLADQAVVSLANFAAAVVVGRLAGQEQLGLYALGYSAYVVMMGLAKAMVWTPYTTRSPHLETDERRRFAASVTAHLGLIAAAAMAAILALGAVLYALAPEAPYGPLFLVLAPCCAAMLLKEHVRRICLAELRVAEVFAVDALLALLQVALLAVLVVAGVVSAAAAFVAIGAASLAAVLWLVVRSKRFDYAAAKPLADWRRNWDFSRWLTGSALAALIGTQGYRWALPVITSLAELGRFGMAQSVIQVANPLLLGVSNYYGPASAKIYSQHGIAGLWRHAVRSTVVLGAALAVLLTGLVALGPTLLEWLYLDAAEGVGVVLLAALGLGILSDVLLMPIDFAFMARSQGRILLQASVVRLVLNLTVGLWLVSRYGVAAIGLGILMGNLVSLLWQWTVFAREVRRG
ncbi:lipopolysaccharide biosynthesis protein [Pseudobythopirellula maris]|uniref:lipopolysaccharide biosynthesis protein n=1 Tax=Pseudobythopirellula maris TaxID=2527991 RepID=UPI0011B80106|nr:hypothetical protein [Pseudobythopirellula maris]